MADSLEVVVEKIDNLQDDLTEVKTDIKDIKKSIYGNGDKEAGLMGRVNIIEKFVDSRVWAERVVIGLLLAEAVGIIFIIIKHVFNTP